LKVLIRKEKFMVKRFAAEAVATMILVLLGCGTAMAMTFAGQVDFGAMVGIAAAFGVSIVILAYTVGPISGGHANPAVSFAKALNKEITWKEFGIYCCAQVLGAFVGSLLLALVMWAWKSGVAGQTHLYNSAIAAVNLEGNKGLIVMLSTMAEMGLTFLFVFAVLGLTSKKEWSSFAGIGIGLVLFGVHLCGIPLTGTSVNPARALSAEIFAMFDGNELGDKALNLIPAIVGPFLGSFAAWSAWHGFFGKKSQEKAA
jgi:aquaporin Z